VDIKENFKVLFRDLDISDLKSAILESPQSDWEENKTGRGYILMLLDTQKPLC